MVLRCFVCFLLFNFCSQFSFPSFLFAPSIDDQKKIHKVRAVCGVVYFEDLIAGSGKDYDQVDGLVPDTLCAAYNCSRKVLKEMNLPEVDDAWEVYAISQDKNIDAETLNIITDTYMKKIKRMLEGRENLDNEEQKVLESIKKILCFKN